MRAVTVNEAQNFTRGKDVKGTLGVGMWGQIKQICQQRGRKFSKKDLQGLFLICARENRYDLMDFLIDQGLDINSNKHEIIRVLAWEEQYDVMVHLVLKRGADIDGAIKDAQLRNEWKTERYLDEIKERAQKHIATPVHEAHNFERGMGPRGAMKIGGIDYQEDFAFDFAALYEKYINKLKKLEGKTISCSVIIGFDPVRKTLTVAQMFDSGLKMEAEDIIALTQWFEDINGDRYQLNLKEKIYIEK